MKKEFIRRYGWTLLGIVAGMVGGYLYWRYVGCSTGTCPITSSPVNSSIWGAQWEDYCSVHLYRNVKK